MIDSPAIIPWVTSAAYLPFVFTYFYRTIRLPSFQNSIKLSIFYSLLFLSGYTSYFIYTSYLLLFALIGWLVWSFKNQPKARGRETIKQLAIAALSMVFICSPALISYIQFFPEYSRGSGLSLNRAQFNPFRLQNTISYLLPPASYKIREGNDPVSRNAYIGIIPLIFIIYSFRERWFRLQYILLGLFIASFLFSLGSSGFIRGVFFRLLPFMDTFRHPGAIRIFTTIFLLLLAGFGLNQYLATPNRAFINKIVAGFIILITTIIAVATLTTNNIDEVMKPFSSIQFNTGALKVLIDNSDFSFWVIVAGVIQLMFLLLMFFRKSIVWLCFSVATNFWIMSCFSFPFTTVSQYRTADVNSFISSFPQGFPAGEAWKPVTDVINDSTRFGTLGYQEFYTRRISIQDHIVHPTVTSAYGAMLRDTALRKKISLRPFAYLRSGDSVYLKTFHPNSFSFTVNTPADDTLYITQQYSRNWKAHINGTGAVAERSHYCFMKLPLKAGRNEVTLVYSSMVITVSAIIALLFFIGCIVLLSYFRVRS